MINAFGQIQDGRSLGPLKLDWLPLPSVRGPRYPGRRRHDGPVLADHLKENATPDPASADRTRAQSQ